MEVFRRFSGSRRVTNTTKEMAVNQKEAAVASIRTPVISTASDPLTPELPTNPIDLPQPHWKALKPNQAALGQGSMFMPDGVQPFFVKNTCGELMPIVPSAIRPRRDSRDLRKRQHQPQNSRWNSVTCRYEVQLYLHVGKFNQNQKAKSQERGDREKPCVFEIQDVELQKVGRVDIQKLKERYEKALLDGTACEDSSLDDFITAPSFVQSRQVRKSRTNFAKQTRKHSSARSAGPDVDGGKVEQEVLQMSRTKNAAAGDTKGENGWETCSSSEG